MAKVRSEHYITIQEFMVHDLELSGNELIAYALIYGFSQDEESCFKGSLSYVARWLNCSKTTACTILNKLADDGFLEKKEKNINGVKLCDYTAYPIDENVLQEIKERKRERKEKEKAERYAKKLNGVLKSDEERLKNLNRYAKNLNDGVQKTLTNNTIDIIDENIRDKNNSLSSERASESDSTPTKKQSRKKESNELFERVWKLYPKKIGKGQVSDTQKLKLLDIGYDELSRAIQRCCTYNKDKDKQYWQNGSTFFNSGYIDFLDENYQDCNSLDDTGAKEIQKEPLNEKEKIRLGIEKARQEFGDKFGEEYWEGMDDGKKIVMLQYLGISIDNL